MLQQNTLVVVFVLRQVLLLLFSFRIFNEFFREFAAFLRAFSLLLAAATTIPQYIAKYLYFYMYSCVCVRVARNWITNSCQRH